MLNSSPLDSLPLSSPTVRSLHTVLGLLLERYADTPVTFPDGHGGFSYIKSATLYNTADALERGEVTTSITILLHNKPV